MESVVDRKVHDDDEIFERDEEVGQDNKSEGTEMVNAYNQIDIDQIYLKVQTHDPKFDKEGESGQTYKERIFYFKLAKNL
jgi:hypothetical protein